MLSYIGPMWTSTWAEVAPKRVQLGAKLSFEVKLPTTWTDEATGVRALREEKRRRKKSREEKESEEGR